MLSHKGENIQAMPTKQDLGTRAQSIFLVLGALVRPGEPYGKGNKACASFLHLHVSAVFKTTQNVGRNESLSSENPLGNRA